MIPAIIAFLILCMLFFGGIKFLQKMNGSQALALTKVVSYSILCAVLALSVLVGIVILF